MVILHTCVILHTYVKLPEGILLETQCPKCLNVKMNHFRNEPTLKKWRWTVEVKSLWDQPTKGGHVYILYNTIHSFFWKLVLYLARLQKNVDHSKQPNRFKPGFDIWPVQAAIDCQSGIVRSATQLEALTFDHSNRQSTVSLELCEAQHS